MFPNDAYAKNDFYGWNTEYSTVRYLNEARRYLYLYPNITCLGVQAAYDANIKMYELLEQSADDRVKKEFDNQKRVIVEEGSRLQTILGLIEDKCD